MTAAAPESPRLPAPADADRSPTIDRPRPAPRSRYRRFVPLATRWTDNDAYGHLNNVVYLSLFDSAINAELVAAGVLDIEHGAVIGLVVETGCHFFSSVAFPQAPRGRPRGGADRPHQRLVRDRHLRRRRRRDRGARPLRPRLRRSATRRPVPLPDGLLAFVKALR
jgi:acyl-CoA thioester hydrolase